MTDQILQLELRFLLLRYGRRRVIESLALLGEQSVDDIERELGCIAERKTRKRTKPKTIDELIAEVCAARPDVAEILRTLATRFENRAFLPQLRDVERFLATAKVTHSKLKSRRVAVPLVVRALAALSTEELHRLATSAATTSGSEYAQLARQIMGAPAERRSEHRR